MLEGGTDEEIVEWTQGCGTPRTDEECHIWNRFIAELRWRDENSHVLTQRIIDSGLQDKVVETVIDHIEYDEGHDPVAERARDAI